MTKADWFSVIATLGSEAFVLLANAVRAPEIVAILARWGFEDLLLQLETPQFLLRNLVRQRVAHLSPYERLRSALEELYHIRKVRQISGNTSGSFAGTVGHGVKKAPKPSGASGFRED